MDFKDYLKGDTIELNESTGSDAYRFIMNAVLGLRYMGGEKALEDVGVKFPEMVKKYLGTVDNLKNHAAQLQQLVGINKEKNSKITQFYYGKAVLMAAKSKGIDIKKLGKPDQETEAAYALIELTKP